MSNSRVKRGWVLAPGLFALAACAVPPAAEMKTSTSAADRAIYVVAHDDHTGIAIRRSDIPAGLWPEIRDFPQAEFLEAGWGARDYYMGRDQGFIGTLRAGLGLMQSVLHVAGFRGRPAEFFRGAEVIEIQVPPEGLVRIVEAIHDTYERAGPGAAAPLAPGLYGDSRFYAARGHFSVLNTCNVWTAQVLRAGGVPVEDAITREGLMSQLRARRAAALPALRAPA